jgi:archaellum component FlaC
MPFTKRDLKDIKDTVIDAVDPYFTALKGDLNHMDDRFDTIDGHLERIEKLILADHKRRIEKLETEVKELKELLAVR